MTTTNLSIIIPVYNEVVHSVRCIQSLLDQRHYGGELEILVIDDGSTDGTRAALQEFEPRIRIIANACNRGHAYTRLIGAQAARFERLLFIDARLTVDEDFLQRSVISASSAVPGVIPATGDPVERVLLLMKKAAFRDHFDANDGRGFYIDRDNFDRSPKGSGGLLVWKKDFLAACAAIDTDDKNTSDDTKLLRYIVDHVGPIYVNPQSVIYYHHRVGMWANARHLYRRGPRFVDYYYGRVARYTLAINGALAVLLVVGLLSFLFPQWRLFFAGLMPLLLGATALWLAEEAWDVVLLLAVLPLIVFSFGLGVLKGPI